MGHDYLIHNLRNQYIDGNSVFGREMRKEAADLITSLLARAEAAEARSEKAERERDAAIKELDDVAAAVDDLSDFIDEQIHPLVQYDMYLALRENTDAIPCGSMNLSGAGRRRNKRGLHRMYS